MVYGAKFIAQALHDLDVKVIFGLPGLPVTDIAQEGLYLGIRFISFRNEQAAVYAATAYGYLTGKPGVCLSVGGPGVFHIMAGVRDNLPFPIVSGKRSPKGNSLADTTRSCQLMALVGAVGLQRNA